LLGPHESEALTVPSCGAFDRAAAGGRPGLLEDTADLVHPRQTRSCRRRPSGQTVDIMRGRMEYLGAEVLCLSSDPARLFAQASCRGRARVQRHLAQVVDAVDG